MGQSIIGSFLTDFFFCFIFDTFSLRSCSCWTFARLCVVCACSFYPAAQAGQPNEISDSFQDFMSQVEELDNLEEFQMDLNTMGVLPANMAHFKS